MDDGAAGGTTRVGRRCCRGQRDQSASWGKSKAQRIRVAAKADYRVFKVVVIHSSSYSRQRCEELLCAALDKLGVFSVGEQVAQVLHREILQLDCGCA